MYEYQWKLFPKKYPVDAQTAGEAIAEIALRRGGVTPQILVEESRDNTSTLHPIFEWDDSIAGEKYRLSQGADVLRGLVIIKASENQDDEPEIIRAFVNVAPLKDTTERKWVPIEQAINDPKLYEQLVNRAYQDLVTFEKKYALLRNEARLKKLFAVLDVVLKEDRRKTPEQGKVKIAVKANGGKAKAGG